MKYRRIPLNNGEERPAVKSPGGLGLGCVIDDDVMLLKGETLVFDFNADYTMVRVFKETPYPETDSVQ